MTIFSVTSGLLSLLCVSIIDFQFVVTMRFIHSNLSIYMITLSSNSPAFLVLPLVFNFFKLINYLFIFGCIGSSLRCTGFSLRWFLLFQSAGSRCAGFSSCHSQALEHRLNSCGARAQLLRSMWDLPVPGHEPVSPALAGGFLTTVPPWKSFNIFCVIFYICYFLFPLTTYCGYR